MLTPEDNALLTRVGPGAPMGELVRRYWHPIAISTQVEADGAPLRTRLLGQRFVVFRDRDGRVGVLNESCMHRGVSLALGRNEEGGLRCIYHGWKFAVDGTILETPNHADCRFRERMKAPAYPMRECAGIIWTYIGPKEFEPPFRELEFHAVPEANRQVWRANVKANWLPLWEGGLDSSHVGILHTNILRPGWKTRNPEEIASSSRFRFDSPAWEQLAPTYEIEDTDFGFQYCAFRNLEGVKRNARMVPAIMPYMRIIPGKRDHVYVMEVPMDDYETSTYVIVYSNDGAIEHESWTHTLGYDNPHYNPLTCDFAFQWDDRLGQDRSTMNQNWTGYWGIELEDFAMSVSLGDDWNRSQEHLVTSDIAVVRLRRRILEALQRFQQGEPPPGVNRANMTKVIAYDLDIEATDRWQDFAPNNRLPVAAT